MDGRFQRVSELFERARQHDDAAARAAFLDASCDDELRDEVDALLAAYDEDRAADPQRDSAVLPGLGEAVAAAWHSTQSEPEAPELVEGFRILERLGAGGMGTVYVAQQIEPARRVALKVLRPEADRDRFRREVLALARLQHPGIAQILLSGECATPMGKVPFLAMELIDGVPVDVFARDLDRTARIELLIRIAEAVAHAHRRGIIHRDLKPSNILVTPDGQPKVLDFGLARATDDSDDGFARQTKTGHLVGTLAYMSPEQAAGTRDVVDTRTDIYALGVIAYETLAGKLPHALDDLPLTRALQTLADEDPAAVPDLRGDLWIILRKALAKDPGMRYGGAAMLADDLRRYLGDEPIAARAPSAMYQARKFVRRHKAPVFGAVATTLALIVGLVLALRAAGRESDQRLRADRERDAARAHAAHAFLKAAAGDLAVHDGASARDNLDRVAPAFRDWEWRYLQNRLNRSTRYERFSKGITADDVLESRAKDQALFTGHALVVEQDLNGRTVRLRDGERTVELSGVTTLARRVRVSPDGSVIGVLQVGWGQGSQLLHLVGGARHTVAMGTGYFGSFCFTPDSRRVVFGGYSGALSLLDVASGKFVHRIQTHGNDDVSAVAVSPDGALVVSGGRDCGIEIRDAASFEVLARLKGHTAQVAGLAFAGDTLLSCAHDGTVRVWDVAERRARDVFLVPETTVLAVAVRGAEVCALTESGVRAVAARRGPAQRAAPSQQLGVTAWRFIPMGARSRARRSRASWWCPTGGAGAVVRTVARNQRVRPFVCAGRVAVLERLATRRQAGACGARHCAGDCAGRIARGASARARDRVRLLRRDGSLESEWEASPGVIEAMAFSADGSVLVVAGRGGFVRAHEVGSGRFLWEAREDGDVGAVACHPTRALVATGGEEQTIVLRDVRTGAVVRTMTGHAGRVWALRFHPSGTRLFSGARDNTVRVWDPETGLEKLRLKGHENYVFDLDVSPCGTTLASASGDFTVRLWSTIPMRERWAEGGR